MGRKLIFLVIILITDAGLYCQQIPSEYGKLTNLADSLFRVKNYCKAATFYNTAFNNKQRYSMDYHHLLAAFSWASCGKIDSSLIQLYSLVYYAGFCNSNDIGEWMDRTIVAGNLEYIALIQYCKHKERLKQRVFRESLARILDSIYVVDQAGRSGINPGNLQVAVTDQSQHSNLRVIDSIYKQNGWLSESEVGYNASLAQFLVIQHDKLKTQLKWKLIIKGAVDSCLLAPGNYALLIDRILVLSGKKQLYGTQAKFDKKKKKYVLYPIKNPASVDSRRMKLGMSRLNENLEVNN